MLPHIFLTKRGVLAILHELPDELYGEVLCVPDCWNIVAREFTCVIEASDSTLGWAGFSVGGAMFMLLFVACCV